MNALIIAASMSFLVKVKTLFPILYSNLQKVNFKERIISLGNKLLLITILKISFSFPIIFGLFFRTIKVSSGDCYNVK